MGIEITDRYTLMFSTGRCDVQVTRTEGNFHFAPGYRLHRHANALSFLDRVQVGPIPV